MGGEVVEDGGVRIADGAKCRSARGVTFFSMAATGTILIVEPDADQAKGLGQVLSGRRLEVVTARGREAALGVLESQPVCLVLTEWDLEEAAGGLDLLDQVRRRFGTVPVVVMTGAPSIEACKQALRHGAEDYLVKPLDRELVHGLVGRFARQARDKDTDFVFRGVVSRSPAMQRLFRVLRRVAPTDITVLIQGESGTGKELTALAIHENSPRRDGPFKPINCAGLSETLLESELFGHVRGAFTGAATDRKGLFEAADGGTLFLDEIGDMPPAMQAKLLRVLEDGVVVPVGSTKAIKVDVRVISATNHDLGQLVEEKKFRQDLFFRIKGVSVTLPPLRHRREDIEELFGYFLKEACEQLSRDIHRITEPAMHILTAYSWPGNIRQLRHTVRTMVALCEGDTLDVEDIPPEVHHVKRLSGAVEPGPAVTVSSGGSMAGLSLEEVERRHIAETLRMVNNNRAEAARILKIGERTLYRKIKEYGL